MREIKKPVKESDIRKWERGWAEMMINIWQENILHLGIVDTGTLHDSMSKNITNNSGQITIAHQFMLYGLYVAHGTGRGYSRNNGGDLDFLDPSYRAVNDLNRPRKKGPAWGGGYTSGNPRTRRNWFSGAYLRSLYVLSNVERALYGHAYMGTMSNVVRGIFSGSVNKGDGGTDVFTLKGID